MKNMNKNLLVKLCGFILMVLCIFILVGCGKGQSKKLWEKYVKAINNQDLDAVAECFEETPEAQAKFKEDHADYFSGLTKIKTKSFNETINCSFSNKLNTQAYYLGEIVVTVNGSTEYNITIYFYENNKGTFFCSYFKIEEGFTANEPNDYWKDKVYFHTDEYLYKNYPTGTAYIEETKNLKNAVVPAEIDGNRVSTIGEYAFYKYTKMLSFTISTSKLRSVVIEEGVDTIGKYAFYQCRKLKELVIPESIRYIDRMAFANCTGLERLEFQTRTKESGSTLELESTSYGEHMGNKLVIVGAHNIQIGEIAYLSAELGDNKVPRVEWTTTSEAISVNASTGKIVANKAGRATVTATLVENRAVTATVEILISEIEAQDCLKMYWDAFSRCPNLKEIIIHAYNPNSFVIDSGNSWLFNTTCKIYVPKGSRDMYVSHALWSKYADQIVELEEDDAEIGMNVALEKLNLTKETAGDIYSVVNPNKIDNIIYLIQNGGRYDLVNAYSGSKIYNNASATIIEETTNKDQLYKLLVGLIGELSNVLDENKIEDLVRDNDENDEDFKQYNKAKDIVYNERKKDNAELTPEAVKVNEIQIVENELNPGVTVYAVHYKLGDGGQENVTYIYINGATTTIFDETYTGSYDLIKVVMASANKVE